MATLNDEKLDMEIGKRLRERAQREVDLLIFMLREADPLTWAKIGQSGLTPNADDWAIVMNKHRLKRAATKAEAAEIVLRARRFYGSGEDCIEFLQHALVDPAWALRNMRTVTEHLADENLVI